MTFQCIFRVLSHISLTKTSFISFIQGQETVRIGQVTNTGFHTKPFDFMGFVTMWENRKQQHPGFIIEVTS